MYAKVNANSSMITFGDIPLNNNIKESSSDVARNYTNI